MRRISLGNEAKFETMKQLPVYFPSIFEEFILPQFLWNLMTLSNPREIFFSE